MKKQHLDSQNSAQNTQNADLGNMLNIINMLSGNSKMPTDDIDQDVTSKADEIGTTQDSVDADEDVSTHTFDKSYLDTPYNDIDEKSSSASQDENNLTRGAIKYLDMMQRHELIKKRVKDRNKQ